MLNLYQLLSRIVNDETIGVITDDDWILLLTTVDNIERELINHNIDSLEAMVLLDVFKHGESYTCSGTITRNLKGKFIDYDVSIKVIEESLEILLQSRLVNRYSSKKGGELCVRPTNIGVTLVRQFESLNASDYLPLRSKFSKFLRKLQLKSSNDTLRLKTDKKYRVAIKGLPQRHRRRYIEITINHNTISLNKNPQTGLYNRLVIFSWNCPICSSEISSIVTYNERNVWIEDVEISCPSCNLRVSVYRSIRLPWTFLGN